MIDTIEHDTIEQTSACLNCGHPVMQAAKRGPRPRLYCNDVCRQLAYRKRQHEQAQEALRQRWADYLPSTREMLEEIMQAHGEALASRVVDAISDERQAIEARYTGINSRESLYRTDTKVRHFKSWLRTHDQPRDTDFAKRFLADTRLPQHASRSMYTAKMRLYQYSEEDISLFEEAWKDMICGELS